MGRCVAMVSNNRAVHIARKEQTMSKDAIYREDAINLCEKWRNRTNEHHDKNGWYIADTLLKAIKELPSADRPQAEWVLAPNGMDWNIPAWRCSRCGFVANYIGIEANGFGRNPMNWAGSNFCPHCGARMKGVDDGRNAD